MDGAHSGFRVDDGAYESFAKNIDPLGDDMRGAASNHIAPHVDLGGDGFSTIGGESGFTGAYGGRMKELEERMNKLGDKWREVAEAARRTRDNYQAQEDDHAGVMGDIGKALG